MKRTLVFLTLCFSVAALGQESWSDFLNNQKKRGEGRPWLLLVQESQLDQPLWKTDDGFLPLLAAREIATISLKQDEIKDVWNSRGWNESREIKWIFTSTSSNDYTTVGSGLPSSGEIKKILINAGHLPLIDRINNFIEINPNNGPANEADIYLKTVSMTFRFRDALSNGNAIRAEPSSATPGNIGGVLINSDVAETIFADIAPALQRLVETPEWWRISNWGLTLSLLKYYDAGKSNRMTKALRDMQSDLLNKWQESPRYSLKSSQEFGSETFGTMWLQLSAILRDKFEIPPIEPVPGDFFPTSSFVNQLCFDLINTGKYNELIDILDLLLLRISPPDDTEYWHDYIKCMQFMWEMKAFCFANLGDKEKCLDTLEHIKKWGAESLQGEESIFQQIIQAFPDLFSEVEKNHLDPMEFEVLKNPTLPTSNQIRLLILKDLDRLSDVKSIVKFWTPKEMYVGLPDENDLIILKNVPTDDCSWAILQRNSIVATGTDFEAIKTTLQSWSSIYQQLNQYVRRNPFTAEGRAKRFHITQNLYSTGDLLENLINDALSVNLPLDMEDIELPDQEIARINRQMNTVKQNLHVWPYSIDLWEAIISWNKIVKTKLLVPNILGEIDFFDEDHIWHARLPKIVHMEMIEHFGSSNLVNELQTWLKATNLGFEVIKKDVQHAKYYDKELHDFINNYLNSL